MKMNSYSSTINPETGERWGGLWETLQNTALLSTDRQHGLMVKSTGIFGMCLSMESIIYKILWVTLHQ